MEGKEELSTTNVWIRTLLYQPVDQVPNCEIGYWPETIRQWKKEGLPCELFENDCQKSITEYFGLFDPWEVDAKLMLQMNPAFEVEVLEEDDRIRVERDAQGAVVRRFKSEDDENSIPQYISFPVANMDDFKRIREERFRVDDPERQLDPSFWDELREKAKDPECLISCQPGSLYGWPRNWMGMESLAIAFYEQPELVEAMMDIVVDLALNGLKQIPDDIPIHYAAWWEDMCYKTGPLISPKLFREYMIPRYKQVTAEIGRHGCQLCQVDSDGNIHELAPLWLEAGVNVLMPCEVAANTDMFWLRKEYGRQMRFTGGIDKRALIKGKEAIDVELDRIAPMVEDGGFIPHVDHSVPPDVSLENFRYYLDKKQRMLEQVKPWSGQI